MKYTPEMHSTCQTYIQSALSHMFLGLLFKKLYFGSILPNTQLPLPCSDDLYMEHNHSLFFRAKLAHIFGPGK